MRRAILILAMLLAAIVLATSAVAYAQQSDKTTPDKNAKPVTTENHSWGGYHWARTSNPFTLKVGDNVNSTWEPILTTTIFDWSQSTVLNMTNVAGGTNPRPCKPTNGRDEVCNAAYGNTGWLGVAQIWITGGTHITQGTTKLNDTYFNTAKYNTTAWRNLVSCQEVGHTLGLDHQDENFNNANLGTCIDYTNDPSTNQHPNTHDYDELQTIYSHLDSTDTILASTTRKGPFGDPNDPRNNPGDGPPAWGKEVFRSADGRESVFEQDYGNGEKKVTHVRWTEERAAQHGGGNKESTSPESAKQKTQ